MAWTVFAYTGRHKGFSFNENEQKYLIVFVQKPLNEAILRFKEKMRRCPFNDGFVFETGSSISEAFLNLKSKFGIIENLDEILKLPQVQILDELKINYISTKNKNNDDFYTSLLSELTKRNII